MADMKYFVHLKDDVVFACHESPNEIDVPGDNIIQVETNGEAFLNKKYIDGSFVDAPVIKYAILDSNNTVVNIESTVFSSLVKGPVISDDNVSVLWTWDGSNFNAPGSAPVIDTVIVNSVPVTTSAIAPAVTAEELQQNDVSKAAALQLAQELAVLEAAEEAVES